MDNPTLLRYSGVGVNTIDVNLTSANQGQANGSGFNGESENSFIDGTIILTYNYTPVPEPAQTASWMLGFAACLLLGRTYLRNRSALSLAS